VTNPYTGEYKVYTTGEHTEDLERRDIKKRSTKGVISDRHEAEFPGTGKWLFWFSRAQKSKAERDGMQVRPGRALEYLSAGPIQTVQQCYSKSGSAVGSAN
jgi:hypothetical protein